MTQHKSHTIPIIITFSSIAQLTFFFTSDTLCKLYCASAFSDETMACARCEVKATFRCAGFMVKYPLSN